MNTASNSGFNERLGRISAGGPNTMGKMLVGPGEEVRAKDARQAAKVMKRKAARKKRAIRTGDGAGDVIAFPFALMLGAATVIAGRTASWQLFTPGGPMADQITLPEAVAALPLPLFADLAIAGVLALMLAWAFRFTTGLKRLGVVLGFGAMISGEIFLVQMFPDIFSNFYAADYVASAATASLPTLPFF
ncbi:MAG: hypothetical protein AAFN59_09885 [Pseudomonadota bacterium]